MVVDHRRRHRLPSRPAWVWVSPWVRVRVRVRVRIRVRGRIRAKVSQGPFRVDLLGHVDEAERRVARLSGHAVWREGVALVQFRRLLSDDADGDDVHRHGHLQGGRRVEVGRVGK